MNNIELYEKIILHSAAQSFVSLIESAQKNKNKNKIQFYLKIFKNNDKKKLFSL